jgi:hypothetical protein
VWAVDKETGELKPDVSLIAAQLIERDLPMPRRKQIAVEIPPTWKDPAEGPSEVNFSKVGEGPAAEYHLTYQPASKDRPGVALVGSLDSGEGLAINKRFQGSFRTQPGLEADVSAAIDQNVRVNHRVTQRGPILSEQDETRVRAFVAQPTRVQVDQKGAAVSVATEAGVEVSGRAGRNQRWRVRALAGPDVVARPGLNVVPGPSAFVGVSITEGK